MGRLFKLYDALLPFAAAALWCGSLKNDKLRRALTGRTVRFGGKGLKEPDDRPGVLIHSASYGEFESVRPLIETLNAKEIRIAVSYSSPSAVRAVESTAGLWTTGYLPLDFLTRQLRFLSSLDLDLILISKHDLWPNLLRAAAMLAIPTVYINASLPHSWVRRLPIVHRFHKRFLSLLNYIWAVSEADAERLNAYIGSNTELAVIGDTRYDRVLQRARVGRERFRTLKAALGAGPIFIAGSTWPQDEAAVWIAFTAVKSYSSQAKLVIAPHEPTTATLRRIGSEIGSRGFSHIPLSRWSDRPISEDILIIDTVGILAELYAVGDAAHVGGGFGRGVHSVIEPAAQGIPVSFGPNNGMSHEASLLKNVGGGFEIRRAEELSRLWVRWTQEPAVRLAAGEKANSLVQQNSGATDRLVARLLPLLGL